MAWPCSGMGCAVLPEDVDILVTKDDLRTIHEKLAGLGYLPVHPHSKHLRDTEFGVRIEFLTSGDFPGGGQPKPVAFPDPRSVSFESDGVSHITLPALIELKLASGMTNPARLKDLADVLELIKLRKLSADYAEQLNPFVRDKYRESCEAAKKYGNVEESEFWVMRTKRIPTGQRARRRSMTRRWAVPTVARAGGAFRWQNL